MISIIKNGERSDEEQVYSNLRGKLMKNDMEDGMEFPLLLKKEVKTLEQSESLL